jgi:hypothetical protein
MVNKPILRKKGMSNTENRSTEWEISFLYRQATYIQKENGFCEQNGSSVKGIRTIVEGDGFVKLLSMHAQNLNATREHVSILKTFKIWLQLIRRKGSKELWVSVAHKLQKDLGELDEA